MGSINPQTAFDNFVANNKDAQKALEIIKQYGNGDPQAAFNSYAQFSGKNVIGDKIKSGLGLK